MKNCNQKWLPPLAAIALLNIALVACGGSGQSPGFMASETPDNSGTPASQRNGRILIIGLDGTRADGLSQANTPNIDQLISNGIASYQAITGDVSLSGPGWASMLTGVWCTKHNVLDNDTTWAQSRFDTYPHFMARLKEARPAARAVSISHWNPINDEIVCAPERAGDAACDGIDVITNVDTDAAVRDAVVSELQNGDADVIFMQFDDIDHAGHGDPPFGVGGGDAGGFCPFSGGEPAGNGSQCVNFNQNYIDTIETTDDYIGDIIAALEARPNYDSEDWLILSSPDHGGSGGVFNQHGFPVDIDRRTFYIVSGNAADSLNATAQPKIVDIAATALFHLGLDIDAAWNLDGRPLGVDGAPDYEEVAIPSCFNQSAGAGDQRGF